MFSFLSGKKIIGIDIGSSSIKLAELDKTGRTYTLSAFGVIPTPAQAIVQGQINDVAAISSAVKSLVTESKTNRKKVATGMWGTSVIVKKVTIPRVDDKVVADQVRFEAEQIIPFDINGIALTHQVLNINTSPDSMDVLIIAAQNELMMNYYEAISMTKLDCSVMDVNSFALANCFEANYGVLSGETVGLMNFGSDVVNFVVIHSGEVIFCRDIGTGGNSLTLEIHKNLGVTISEAEALKISAVLGREVPDEVHSILSSEVERLADEVRSSYDFFLASGGESQPSRFFYSGGASRMPALIQRVSDSIGIKFERLNPFNGIKIDSKKLDPTYIKQIMPLSPVAMGLAMREVGGR